MHKPEALAMLQESASSYQVLVLVLVLVLPDGMCDGGPVTFKLAR